MRSTSIVSHLANEFLQGLISLGHLSALDLESSAQLQDLAHTTHGNYSTTPPPYLEVVLELFNIRNQRILRSTRQR